MPATMHARSDIPPFEVEEPFAQPLAAAPMLSAPAAYLTFVTFAGVLVFMGLFAFIVWHYTPAFAATAPTAAAPARAQLPAASQPVSGHIAPFFTPEVRHWESDILRWATAYHLDPNLVATVMQIESCGNPRAVSSAGARGLFQVMPFHFVANEDPFDPETNARRGLAYLKAALQRSGGNVRLALAGYNGGLGVIGLPENLWPAQTRRYVSLGWPIYNDAVAGRQQSATLSRYFQAGRGMCAAADRQLGLP